MIFVIKQSLYLFLSLIDPYPYMTEFDSYKYVCHTYESTKPDFELYLKTYQYGQERFF